MKACMTCEAELTGLQRKFCSRVCQNKDSNTRLQNYTIQQERAKSRKMVFIEMCGGECSVCGYKKNYAALCFHHLRDKKFTLDSRKCSNATMESLLEELKKCILLCHNCHFETHNPNCTM